MKYFFFLALLFLPLFAFAQENTGFIPLTNTPFIEQTGNAVDLENFLNQMYRLCIGIAAVVAVLQIMRAGIMYMGGDSITEKKEAKNLIALSIGGLILVLSPVIVFSIINPEILSLKIGNLESLRPADPKACEPACGIGESCVRGTCLKNNVSGDQSCSVSCVAGRTCQNGQCVVASAASCTPGMNVRDGSLIPTLPEQNCCQSMPGCVVVARLSDGELKNTCSCESRLPGDDEGGPFTYRFFVAYSALRADGSRAPSCMKTIEETVPLNSTCVLKYNQWLIDFASDRSTYERFATGKGCNTGVYETPYLKANWDRISVLPQCQ